MTFDKPPDTLWLQYYGDGEPGDWPVYEEDITWCVDQVFPQDIEYVRADVAEQRINDAIRECANICNGFDACDPGYIADAILATLLDLK